MYIHKTEQHNFLKYFMILCIRPSWDIDWRCNIDCNMSVLSGVGRFVFLLRSYCQMLSEQSHPMSNFQDRAKHPTLVIPPPKELKWIVGNIFYNKFNHTIIIKTKKISFSGKIMETAHWRKGEKDYTSMWKRKEKVGHLVCEKLVTSTSLKWLKYLGILMCI